MPYATPGQFPLYKAEIFGMQPGDFAALLETAINDQAALLALRVGSLYSSSDTGVVTLLGKAESALVEAELLRLRIIRLVGTVINGDQADLRPLEKQRAELLNLADRLIGQALAGVKVDSCGFAIGTEVSGSVHGFPAWGRSC